MAKIIGFGRCIGKTTMAILESHATGRYIVCSSRKRAEATFSMAKKLGYTVPYPLAVSDPRFREKSGYPMSNESVIVDDVESILATMLGSQIETMTFESPQIQFADDRYVEELAELKKELNTCYKEKEEDQATIEKLKSICLSQQATIMDYEWEQMNRSAMLRKQHRKFNHR